MKSPSLFTLPLDYLRNALAISGGELPQHLGADQVSPTLDVLQGGWAGASVSAVEFTRPQNTATSNETLIAADRKFLRMIYGISGVHTAGAATSAIRFFTRFQGNAAVNVSYRRMDVPVNTNFQAIGDFAGAAALTPGVMGTSLIPWPVFPDWSFEIVWPTTAAGESWTLQMLTVTLPAGVPPR